MLLCLINSSLCVMHYDCESKNSKVSYQYLAFGNICFSIIKLYNIQRLPVAYYKEKNKGSFHVEAHMCLLVKHL